ncbi:hypothetical protein CIPAW_15G106700 [Carya illinoinensis]|uniref:Uncharacterized protein n=1 Tax=Carya illinoinensis TaxID=32201 RepID=A0A8T1NDJ2_CARIL|nr:hypothetical protein CIPAW_15G106700 [Carya illinoinensis]
MKNVAKCDTWCELQNPANHRVFERKLRPKPFGRGHVCLGVTGVPVPNPSAVGGMLELLPRRERVAACRPGDGLGKIASAVFPGRRTVDSELVRTRGIRLFN